MTINDWIESATNKIKAADIESARLDALLLLEDELGVGRESLLAQTEFELSSENIASLKQKTDRRVKHEPVAYILGRREFYGIDFEVNRNVLVPRPETEKMVEHILVHAKPNSRVLDVGTGSGAIAVSLKQNRNDLEVSASEVSHSALDVARRNAAKHDTFIGFIESDLFAQVKKNYQYDVIAANLPYVPLDKISGHPELKHEPALALFPDDSRGLSIYERFFRDIKNVIQSDGWLIVEHDPTQLEDILKLGKLARYNGESVSPFITKFLPIQIRNIIIK